MCVGGCESECIGMWGLCVFVNGAQQGPVHRPNGILFAISDSELTGACCTTCLYVHAPFSLLYHIELCVC